jgi:preflagellin peptidase FlaK
VKAVLAELMQVMEFVSIGVTLFFLALGSFFDLKTREVPDRVWLIYGPLGFALTVYRTFNEPQLLSFTAASIIVTTLLSLGIGYFGLFGGADAKALICLGLTLPLVPMGFTPVLGYVHSFFPIVVIIASFLCSLAMGVWIGLRNLFNYARAGTRMFAGLEGESRWKKVMAMVTGYPTNLTNLRSTFYLYPMEEVAEDAGGARRRFHLMLDAESDRDQLVAGLSGSLGKVGSPERVWVTPGLPMMVFILCGVIITLIFGDPIFWTVVVLARR